MAVAKTADYVDLCGSCAATVDEDTHALNPETRERYCSIECWAEEVL